MAPRGPRSISVKLVLRDTETIAVDLGTAMGRYALRNKQTVRKWVIDTAFAERKAMGRPATPNERRSFGAEVAKNVITLVDNNPVRPIESFQQTIDIIRKDAAAEYNFEILAVIVAAVVARFAPARYRNKVGLARNWQWYIGNKRRVVPGRRFTIPPGEKLVYWSGTPEAWFVNRAVKRTHQRRILATRRGQARLARNPAAARNMGRGLAAIISRELRRIGGFRGLYIRGLSTRPRTVGGTPPNVAGVSGVPQIAITFSVARDFVYNRIGGRGYSPRFQT